MRSEKIPSHQNVLRAVQRAHSPLIDRVMTAVAAPGFPPLSIELLGAGAVALWLMRLRLEAGFLLAAAGGVTAVDVTLKRLIKRKRPTFSETFHGYRSFNALLEDAEHRGMLEIEKDQKSGGYLILSFGPRA